MLESNVFRVCNCKHDLVQLYRLQTMALEQTKQIPDLFFGTFQVANDDLLRSCIDAALKTGIRGFDTAPSYNTQKKLGSALSNLLPKYNLQRSDVFISDKVDIKQMVEFSGKINQYVIEMIKQSELDYLDCLLIHWPYPSFLMQTWNAMEELVNDGYVKQIGLCNVNRRILDNVYDKCKIPPSVIQIERHPLLNQNTFLSDISKENVSVQVYSPLGRMDLRIKESKILQMISEKHNVSIAQVILLWHKQSNCIPVFTSTKQERIVSNSLKVDLHLDLNELNAINSIDENFKIFVESICCPGF